MILSGARDIVHVENVLGGIVQSWFSEKWSRLPHTVCISHVTCRTHSLCIVRPHSLQSVSWANVGWVVAVINEVLVRRDINSGRSAFVVSQHRLLLGRLSGARSDEHALCLFIIHILPCRRTSYWARWAVSPACQPAQRTMLVCTLNPDFQIMPFNRAHIPFFQIWTVQLLLITASFWPKWGLIF